MANITKNVWTEYNGKKFGAAYAEYAQVANTDVAGNSLQLTIADGKVTEIGGKSISSATGGNVHLAEYGITPFATIKAGLDNGEVWGVLKDEYFYSVSYISATRIIFSQVIIEGKNIGVASIHVNDLDDWVLYYEELKMNQKTFTLFAPDLGATYTMGAGTSSNRAATFTVASDTPMYMIPISTMTTASAGFKAGETVRIIGAYLKAGNAAGLQTPAKGTSTTSSSSARGSAMECILYLYELDSSGIPVDTTQVIKSIVLTMVDWNTWETKDITLTMPDRTTGTSFGFTIIQQGRFECDDYNIAPEYVGQTLKPELLLRVETNALSQVDNGSDII